MPRVNAVHIVTELEEAVGGHARRPLAQLGRRLDKTRYVLKGGCNLRFFHRSIRLSDDLDLDVAGIGRHALQDKVRLLLRSGSFAQVLGARGMALERVSEPKQTETTQRWKVGLRSGSGGSPLPTKIEFSRRGLDGEVGFGSVDPQLIRTYQMPPFMLSHYRANAALCQKIGALANRSPTLWDTLVLEVVEFLRGTGR